MSANYYISSLSQCDRTRSRKHDFTDRRDEGPSNVDRPSLQARRDVAELNDPRRFQILDIAFADLIQRAVNPSGAR